jgi:DNA-binding MarR family transcriptional regulator
MSNDWLKALGLDEIWQWDVLVFLHRHRDALLGADHIARLLGYDRGVVASALDHLESAGLVERSRVSQGVRLYHLNRLSGSRRKAFEELVASTDSRAGRLALVNKLPASGEASPSSDDPSASTDGPGSQSRRGGRRTEAADSGTQSIG